MTLLELADRVEALDAPDREVDRSIWEALGNCAHRKIEKYVCQGDSGFTCVDCGKDMYGRHAEWPPFTASIDAAMQLVPEGFWTGHQAFEDGSVNWTAYSNHPATCFGDNPHGNHAAALTAAALRARAAQESE